MKWGLEGDVSQKHIWSGDWGLVNSPRILTVGCCSNIVQTRGLFRLRWVYQHQGHLLKAGPLAGHTPIRYEPSGSTLQLCTWPFPSRSCCTGMFARHKLCVLYLQSCLILCNPMDCSLPCSSVHGNLQARILEWVTISSSRGSSPLSEPPRKPARHKEHVFIFLFAQILNSLPILRETDTSWNFNTLSPCGPPADRAKAWPAQRSCPKLWNWCQQWWKEPGDSLLIVPPLGVVTSRVQWPESGTGNSRAPDWLQFHPTPDFPQGIFQARLEISQCSLEK